MKYESQLQITTAAAVPPLTVNQTALVTNFNADLLDGQHGAYYATAASLSGYLPLTGGTLTGTLTGTVGIFTTVRTTELTSLLGSNGPITITPDGTGHVHINSTDIRLGPNNTNATLATRGTGDLILRTNEGSAVEGYIKIFDGANGNIEITPNGTGTVVVGKLSGSTASFSGQITSTVATGTAPFVVTSTTRVNNLNVQYLDGQLSTYYAAASSLASYLPLSGGAMTGTLALHSTGANGFYNGTGDAATYALYNFKLGGWNGMALENLAPGGTYPSQVVGVIDFRSGTIDMKGGFKVNGASVITENQSITISGDASGTGKTAINLTLASVGTAGTYRSVTTDAKGRVTAGTNPTTLAGYGITDALDTSGTAQTKSGNLTVNSALTSGGAFYAATTVQYSNRQPVYTLFHGGAQDLAWKKIADVTFGTGLYRCATFKIDVVDNQSNFGYNSACFPMTYFVSCRRSGGVQDDFNDAIVYGPVADYVRAVKTATGVYEIQVRQIADWLTHIFTVENTINGAATVTYASGTPANGSTAGTIYAATAGWAQRLPNLTVTNAINVAGQITSTVATGTAPLVITSTTLVSNLNSDLLDGQHGSYFEGRDTTAVGFSAGTLTLTRATGNLTVSLDGRYLPLSGGTLTGSLTVPTQLAVIGTTATDILRLYVTGSTIWKLGVTDASGSLFNITADFGNFTINKTNGNVTTPGSFISTVATGTAPLSITSTTLVSNLNADYLDGQHGSYYQNASNLNAGTVPAAQMPAHTGDVTSTAGSVALTIANDTVTNAKLKTMGAGTIKGNNGAVANSPSDLTAAQVATMLSGQTMNIAGSSTSCTGNAASASSVPWSGITSKPTTLSGFGITDSMKIGGAPGGDLNAFTTSGVYRINNTESNRPNDWGQLLVMYGGSDTITQIYGHYVDGTLKTRSGNPTNVGGSGSWSPWRTLLGDHNYSSYALPLTGGTLTGGLSGTTGSFSGEVTWSGWNSGNARAVRIGYSGGNYGGIGYGINYTATTGSHTYSIADAVTRIDLADGIQVYSAATGTVGAAVSWTTLLEATRGNGNLRWKGNTVLDSNNYNSFALPLSGGTMTGNIILPATGYVGLNGGSTFGIGTLATNRNSGVFDTVESTGTDPLELNYYQGGAVKIGSGTYGSKSLYAAGIFDGGNQVVHAGNVSTYALPIGGGTLTGQLTIATGGATGLRVNSPSGTQGFWLRVGYDTDGTATPVASALNTMLQSSGSSAGTFTIVCGNDRVATLSNAAANFAVALQQGGNQVIHAGNYTSYPPARWATARTISLTGDVTGTSGGFDGTANLSFAATIANDTVTNAKLKTMGASTIKGNNGGVANSPSDLTPAQVATMLSGQTMNIAGSSTSCTGNAVTATNVAWSGITSKPTTLSGFGITDALPLSGGTLTGRTFVSIGSRTTSYTGSNFEVYTGDNTPPGISFHRGGYSATLLYENDGELYTNPWTTRGQTGKLLAAGNYQNYALPLTGGTVSGLTSFTASESINAKGIRGQFTNEYLHLYSKVGIGNPTGWGTGETNTPGYGLSTYGGINVAYGNSASSTFNGAVNVTGALTQSNNQVLHAGNYIGSYIAPQTNYTTAINATGYTWIRIPYASGDSFNGGQSPVEFYVTRSIYDNSSTPYGGPTAKFVIQSMEWHNGQQMGTIQYGERGDSASLGAANWITHAKVTNMSGGGYWVYMRLRTGTAAGVTYMFRKSAVGGQGLNLSSIEATTDPGGAATIYYGFNLISAGTEARFYRDGNMVLDAGTYNSYAPTLTGTGASGTWGISISGSAAQLNGQAASYYLNASNLNAGTVPAARMPAYTGDVTSTAGTVALTIANDTVTNAKLKTMGAGTIKGNNGGVANTPSDLTAAQVATMLSGQTMNIAGSSASCTGNAATATTSTRLSDASNGLRIANPGGGSYATGASTATGAIKIKLPTASFKSNTMFRFTVKIYQYAGGSSGLSRTIEIGGYNYSDAAANWYNIFAYQNTMGGGELNVRFGNDGTSQCVWIGEIATVWDYPQVTVTDFQGGYSNYTDAIWATGWGITFATAFDTVTQGPIVAAKPINSQNYSSYAPTLTGGGASGTWGINITGSSASCTGNAATSSSCSGNAATASAVAASGITGQTGMWTSAARPGPYRLYRRDVNDAYSVQNYWTGTYWRLDGYYSNDTVHAGCSVAYADTAGSASSASSATNSTQLNGQAASYYENRDTTAVGISAGTLTLTRAAGNLTTTIGGRVVAWCDFNGNFASTQTPNANFNVSSITKNATGDYTVNFSSALANANYVVAGSAQLDAPSPGQSTYNVMVAVPRRSGAKATGSCRIVTEYPLGVTLYDSVSVGVAFIAA